MAPAADATGGAAECPFICQFGHIFCGETRCNPSRKML
jgi:hypothetical protein